MLFNSQLFLLVFLPVVVVLHGLAGARRLVRQTVLVGASLCFYADWNPRYVPLLLGLALATWLIADLAVRRGGRAWAAAGIVLNLAVLGVCKYANFALGTVAALFGHGFRPLAITLPLGISFFVFQKIAYLADIARGDRRRYGLLDFLEFVTFFPQLIAGPIVRHHELIPQFERPWPRADAPELFARGLVLFTIGLAKKAGLADNIAVNSDALFAAAAAGHAPGFCGGWVAAITYALQIYFDFSGYSDMAIGLALLFGLRLPFNFDAPYRAHSVRDFWRRWHMTLSRFLRDYVYIPLGGNRAGGARVALNLVVTMLLGGLWHGAAWTFVAWGVLHGTALAINHAWRHTGIRVPEPLGFALTLGFVLVAWIPFRAPDFATAGRLLGAMAGLDGWHPLHVRNAIVVGIGIAVALLGPTSQQVALERLGARPLFWAIPAGALLGFLVVLTGGGLPQEFIYFQF